MEKQFVDQAEADKVLEKLRNMAYPELSTVYKEDPKAFTGIQRVWLACKLVDFVLDSYPTRKNGEDIHVTLARVIVEMSEHNRCPVDVKGRVTAKAVGNPYDSVCVYIDGIETYKLTNVVTEG